MVAPNASLESQCHVAKRRVRVLVVVTVLPGRRNVRYQCQDAKNGRPHPWTAVRGRGGAAGPHSAEARGAYPRTRGMSPRLCFYVYDWPSISKLIGLEARDREVLAPVYLLCSVAVMMRRHQQIIFAPPEATVVPEPHAR
jgi:hypothetical protein